MFNHNILKLLFQYTKVWRGQYPLSNNYILHHWFPWNHGVTMYIVTLLTWRIVRGYNLIHKHKKTPLKRIQKASGNNPRWKQGNNPPHRKWKIRNKKPFFFHHKQKQFCNWGLVRIKLGICLRLYGSPRQIWKTEKGQQAV